jgi:hypothetical protein
MSLSNSDFISLWSDILIYFYLRYSLNLSSWFRISYSCYLSLVSSFVTSRSFTSAGSSYCLFAYFAWLSLSYFISLLIYSRSLFNSIISLSFDSILTLYFSISRDLLDCSALNDFTWSSSFSILRLRAVISYVSLASSSFRLSLSEWIVSSFSLSSLSINLFSIYFSLKCAIWV